MTVHGFNVMAVRAVNVKECQMLWRSAQQAGLLTEHLKTVLRKRVEQLKGAGQ
jgi:hypothetical protein